MGKFLSSILAVAAVAAAATPAFADPISIEILPEAQVRASVDIRGLSAGEVDRRIELAARRVCGNADSRTIFAMTRVESCRSAAEADARLQVAGLAGSTIISVSAIY